MGIDVAKGRNAIAIADGMHVGEVRYLGEVDASPASMTRIVRPLAGFDRLYEAEPETGNALLLEVACWAHGRRKLFEAHPATGSARAKAALERMAELFEVESEINGHDLGRRRAVRQDRSLPLLADLKDFLDAALAPRQHQPQELARDRDPLQPRALARPLPVRPRRPA